MTDSAQWGRFSENPTFDIGILSVEKKNIHMYLKGHTFVKMYETRCEAKIVKEN